MSVVCWLVLDCVVALPAWYWDVRGRVPCIPRVVVDLAVASLRWLAVCCGECEDCALHGALGVHAWSPLFEPCCR